MDKFCKYQTMYDYLGLHGKISANDYFEHFSAYMVDAETYQQMIKEGDVFDTDRVLDPDHILIVRQSTYKKDFNRTKCIDVTFHRYGDYMCIFDSYDLESPDMEKINTRLLAGTSLGLSEWIYCQNYKIYYKVHSTVIDMMMHTRVSDIPIHSLKLPVPAFTILLPKGNPTGISQILLSLHCPEDLNTDSVEITPDCEWSLDLYVLCQDDDKLGYMYSKLCISPKDEGMTIEDLLMSSVNANFSSSSEEKKESSDLFLSAWNIAFTVILLATGGHKWVEEDVMEELLDAYRTGNKRQRKKIRHKSRSKGHTGYAIGRLDGQRRLPNGVTHNPQKTNNAFEPSEKRRMHLRCGHFRLQACGNKWKQHKAIWIMPMMINQECVCK